MPAASHGAAPGQFSSDGVWERIDEATAARGEREPRIKPDVFHVFSLNHDVLDTRLDRIPLESESASLRKHGVITLPNSDGTYARYQVVESPIMAPELAAKFPQIKTYLGRGMDDPSASVRFDRTPKGFHAQILSARGAFYIDPYFDDDPDLHVVYAKRDYGQPVQVRSCTIVPGAALQPQSRVAATAQTGDTLRTYRLALAATAEYTQFHGGTVADGMAAIVTAMNRVNGIYEVEVAVRMILVAGNEQLIYTNAATDPYTNGSGSTMLGENQSNLSSVIGVGNYDIGHVFSTGGGGVAGLRVVCWNNAKAWGVTGLSAPIGDPFYVDFVSHEMGHQFGGNHTFNGVTGSCCCGNRNSSHAYEPGSGSTIMAYAGICGSDNLQANSDPYFAFASLDEIRNYITTGTGSSCPSLSATGNTAPSVEAGRNYTIPQGTPFALTATGFDLDNDPLTYGWEEADLGPGVTLATPDNGSSPLFRSLNPTPSPTRFFPRLKDLLAGVSFIDEKLPETNRTMNFRVTVRDNRAGGGGVASDQRSVTVHADAGPFEINSPSFSVVAGENQTVTWTTTGTNAAPINTTEVNILYSIDGGATFPFTLASNTPNDGIDTVLIPDVVTASARLKIEAVDNVYFAISETNLASGSCVLPTPPEVDVVVSRNRYLGITAVEPGTIIAIRVRLKDLPAPYDVFNGAAMWVGEPSDVSENGSSVDPLPGFPDFKAAALQCTPFFADFSAMGTIQVYHESIVPGGQFAVQAVLETCDATDEGSFSQPVSEVSTSRWGDTIGDCASFPCSPPDQVINIIDVAAIISRFASDPNSIVKARADLEPACPDLLINISDALRAIGGFQGLPYPFAPSVTDPCDLPCPAQ